MSGGCRGEGSPGREGGLKVIDSSTGAATGMGTS